MQRRVVLAIAAHARALARFPDGVAVKMMHAPARADKN
jgi:hypothetical protein